MDRKLASEKIRARLEKRLANFLGCQVGDLPRMKLGALVHALFLFEGDTEMLPGFNTAMGAVLQLLGREIVWDEPKAEETEPRVVVN